MNEPHADTRQNHAGWARFNHHDLHMRLCDVALSQTWAAAADTDDYIETQALFCPYYVPLEGKLGADWGVIVNPESSRFTLLTFEHDDCGCPGDFDRHVGAPSQQGDTWDVDWRHMCDDMCDDPCEEAAP